jgi:uncharacterized membrane protein
MQAAMVSALARFEVVGMADSFQSKLLNQLSVNQSAIFALSRQARKALILKGLQIVTGAYVTLDEII